MNKVSLKIIAFPIAAAGLFLSLPSSSQALTLRLGEEQYAVPAATVTSWKGSFLVPSQTNLKPKPLSYKTYIAGYLGLPVKKEAETARTFQHDPAKIYAYIKGLAAKIDQQPQEPSLKIKNGKVEEFIPPEDGITVDVYTSSLAALTALADKKESSDLSVVTVAPEKSLAAMNDLGINELIAEGVSNFSGSPSNRRHNIAVGVNRMKGIIIKPGGEFSFNKYLGPVEAAQGYLPELVIRRDKGTVPELGGGLCQVSSTVFRAAMKAGLPITQRRNHAYAVKYYAPQGTDATIYPGVIDIRFMNDTPASILVWPEIKEGSNLVFNFYGTKDGREVKLGTPYQYDKKADGSMKATWERTITKNGKSESETFKSTYLPPALFHKEEKFVPATPAPTETTTTPVGNSTGESPPPVLEAPATQP